MLTSKPWWASKTIWGGVIAVSSGVVGVTTGIVIPDIVQQQVVEVVVQLGTILGGALAVYGRFDASKKVQ